MNQIEKLKDNEKRRFQILDELIAKGKVIWIEVGRALVEILDERLYREQYSTFVEYCEKRHGFTARRARQLIEGAKIVDESGTRVPLLENERQARELSKVPKEKRDKVWERASKESNGKPVKAKAVRRAAREIEREEGGDLPVVAAAALETGESHHAKALDLLTQLSTVINELVGESDGDSPMIGGELLAGYRQEVCTDIKNLRETIKASRPHALCPYCKNDPKRGPLMCSACKNLGWVTEQVLREAPEEK